MIRARASVTRYLENRASDFNDFLHKAVYPLLSNVWFTTPEFHVSQPFWLMLLGDLTPGPPPATKSPRDLH